MGLHIDIDAVNERNKMNITGKRKQGFLVNDGDKLTPDEKHKLQRQMQREFGLDKRYVEKVLILPPPQNIKIDGLEKILNSRKKLSLSEKLDHLHTLQRILKERLEMVNNGKVLLPYKVQTYKDWCRENQVPYHGIDLATGERSIECKGLKEEAEPKKQEEDVRESSQGINEAIENDKASNSGNEPERASSKPEKGKVLESTRTIKKEPKMTQSRRGRKPKRGSIFSESRLSVVKVQDASTFFK